MAGPLIILDKFLCQSARLNKTYQGLQEKEHSGHHISKDELSDAISIASGENKDDEKILKGIIKFGNIDAREIMKPRIDVIAIDIKTPFNEVNSADY